MKKYLFLLVLCASITVYSQKKKEGTVYSEHPAIVVVESMQKAFIKGDTATVASYLSEDFRSMNGSVKLADQDGQRREAFLNSSLFWKANVDYFDIVRQSGAFPDVVEYKESGTWVQTWEIVKGVHKKTGVKIEHPIHRLFLMNDENQIQLVYSYMDESIFDEIGRSFQPRTNGTIYNNHDNINTVRKMIYAFENGDYDTAYSFFTEDAKLSNIHMAPGESVSPAEDKKNAENFFKNFDFVSANMVGYPDYLHYEKGNAKVVQSWWNFILIRKSDDKRIELPIHFLHDFNDDGKITSAIAYFSAKMLEE